MIWGPGMNGAKMLPTAFADTNIDRSSSGTFGETTSPETKSFGHIGVHTAFAL